MMVMAMMPVVTMPVVAMPMVMVMTMRPPVLMVVMVARPPVVSVVAMPPLHVGRQLAGVALRGCGNARTDRRRRLRLLRRNREGQKRTEDDKS